MSAKKTLTEDQAQELANLINCFIATDADETVCAFMEMPCKDFDSNQMNWYPVDFEICTLPIKIESNKPWYDQIWEPQNDHR